MSNRIPRKKFLELWDALWQDGPRTEYRNPDSWTTIQTGRFRIFQPEKVDQSNFIMMMGISNTEANMKSASIFLARFRGTHPILVEDKVWKTVLL
jgi:hypothetical protein